MTCAAVHEALVDLVDGRLARTSPLRVPAGPPLGGGAEREIQRHLDSCESCHALVTDLRTIRAAAFTLDRREPDPGIWEALQAKVAAEPLPTGDRRVPLRAPSNWPVWAGAAATLVLATAIGLAPLALRSEDANLDGAAQAEVTVESVAAEFEAAEKHYQKAITDLQSIANADTGELDPQVAAVLQKNLSVIDQAISENRAALQLQPSSRNAQDGLFGVLRTKVALLQQTVELINEMRQGNQTEAGLKFQGLAQ